MLVVDDDGILGRQLIKIGENSISADDKTVTATVKGTNAAGKLVGPPRIE